MKHTFLFSILSIIIAGNANAATPWWLQPTVCRLDPTNCYSAMGTGYNTEMWDATSKCWGLKIICADALTASNANDTEMGRAEIARGTGISQDFDTDLLSADGECFGRRKTAENGTIASVGGKYVNVWCNGILDNPDEILSNGEITYGAQPTCTALAEYGYIGIENGNCYGKYYDTNDYYIECGTSKLEPTHLIVLNGADYNAPMNGAPADENAAERLFDTMYSVSQAQKEKYFKD